MSTPVEMQYSLWFVPEEGSDARIVLDKAIALMASTSELQSFTGPNDHPLFVPHLTVLPDISGEEAVVLARTKELASQLSPLILTCQSIGYMETLFRTLYIEANPTPELQEAGRKARQIFGREESPISPHISLLYQLGLGEAAKKTFIARLRENNLISFPEKPISFQVNHIEVWTSPKPDDIPAWKEVARFTLGK